MFSNNKNTEQQKLINGCIKNKPQFQSQLYNKYKGKMFGVCLRYCSDYHKAEDVLQEGFVKIFKNISKFRGDGSFEGWMRRIFVNTAIEHYRKSVNLYPILEVTEHNGDVYYDKVVEQMAANDLMKIVQELSPGYRVIFNMYVVEGYTHKQIAQKLEISEGTSKSQLARAKQILKVKVSALQEQEQKVYGKANKQ